jgi:hypothetical protein
MQVRILLTVLDADYCCSRRNRSPEPTRRRYMIRQILLVVVVLLSGCGASVDVSGPDTEDRRITVTSAATPPAAAFQPPANIRDWYRNDERPGSCVQMSIAIAGVKCNNLKAATLPFDTIYGPAIRGGSTPSRVAAYCEERGIKVYNVTGEATWSFLEWAADTGRCAAMGADKSHFQTLMARDKERGLWYVCDNRWPENILEYNDAEFRQLHQSMGYQWCVVIDCPTPPNMVLRRPGDRK